MIVLYIILAVTAFVVLLLFSSLKLYVKWDESLSLKAGFWFIRLDLLKLIEKKPKENKKSKKQKEKHTENKPEEKKKRSFSDIIGFVKFITKLLKKALKELSAALKIKVNKLDVTVASSSPDKTAMLYGTVCSAVYQLCEVINRFTRSDIAPEKIRIESDFILPDMKAELDIRLSLRVIDIIRTGGIVLLTLTELKGVDQNERNTLETSH